jgi:hypothetical protein
MHSRWTRVPGKLREKVSEYFASQVGKFKPITDSARVILQAGLLALSLYVLAYIGLAWLDMAGSFYRAQMGSGYLLRGMTWMLGPHPWSFWSGVINTMALISHLIVEPLRICLVAATLAYCLERHNASDDESVTAATESESIRSTS